MLTIDHLEKQFGSTVLFRDLTFTVDGPAVLWAPSGWGKTTLLRILMGLDTPTAGRVRGVGRAAAVFQEDRLCPQLTALQNVTLVLPGSEKQYKEQIRIVSEVLHSRNYNPELKKLVKGVMIESYLLEGRQDISDHMTPGCSITDPCLGWEDTERLIYDIAEKC